MSYDVRRVRCHETQEIYIKIIDIVQSQLSSGRAIPVRTRGHTPDEAGHSPCFLYERAALTSGKQNPKEFVLDELTLIKPFESNLRE
jgi:hypothetical protein